MLRIFISVAFLIDTCLCISKLCIFAEAETYQDVVFTLKKDNQPIFAPILINAQSQCWNIDIQSDPCYTYSIAESDHINQVDIHINDRLVGSYDQVIDTNHFCLSLDLVRPPIPFISNEHFQSNSNNLPFSIHHRDRSVFSKFTNLDPDAVCIAFRSVQMEHDILSLRLPENDQDCDQIITPQSFEYGFCECFAGRILIEVMGQKPASCLDVCNSVNNGCHDGIPDAMFIPNAITGCDHKIPDGLQSVTDGVCSEGWHVCRSGRELDYLGLSGWMCRDISSFDTFYVSLDDTECFYHRGEVDVLMGCGNKKDSNLPIALSYCDIFSHSISSALMPSDPHEEQEWYIADLDGTTPLSESIMKRSKKNGGILCCVDSDWNEKKITWSKWELVLLAIAHAIFLVIFVLTLAVMCERIIRHVIIRRILRRYRMWKQRKRLVSLTKHGSYKKYKQEIEQSNCTLCAICLDEYRSDHRVLILRCGHHYHHECATRWLLEHDSCPQCLQPVVDARDLRHSLDMNAVTAPNDAQIEMNTEDMNVIASMGDLEMGRSYSLGAQENADVERRSVHLLSDAAQSAPELAIADHS